ncbi:Clavaminate synthase-like protein, partial [Mycena crocata]
KLQNQTCRSKQYRQFKPDQKFSSCAVCTRQWRKDACRFMGIRSFSETEDGSFVFRFGDQLPESKKLPEFPLKWNLPLEDSHVLKTQEAAAAALLPLLHQELLHIDGSRLTIYRPLEMEVRVICDTCLTSIFSCSWLCRNCGRESCAECLQKLHSLNVETRTGSEERTRLLMALAANRDFCNCVRGQSHTPQDFIPTTRFQRAELEEAIKKMQKVLDATSAHSNSNSLALGTSQHVQPPFLPSSHNSAIPFYYIPTFKDSDLTENIFSSIWATGNPLLVTDIGHKFKIDWSPHYFIAKHGQETCEFVECQTSVTSNITVEKFFETFGTYEGRTECRKVKDWPPSEDFKSIFPELYEDFSQAVPVPNYVRRDGVLNIASHFPMNAISPDLGPKMYNAHANLEASENQGSTRLHMDMADAVNIMTYAAPDPKGLEGCAAWDIFQAGDSEPIRQFIRLKFDMEGNDPIHSQQIYLDDDLRLELWQQFDVKSYRIYQRPGEAVFIPAGCAHQVRNLSDCIKVAIDFVSPENIEQCKKVTKEFQEHHGKAWKEDVLQLKTMMWYAWKSCSRFHTPADETA